jgi:4-amino-4-deoxy-L-arabinose transferase-like glycosyltransferase
VRAAPRAADRRSAAMPANSSRALIAAASIVYVLLHVASISRSHIPWFDDTFFASIADTLHRTGKFTLSVSPLWLDEPVYLYGPTYFLIVAAVFASFGIGVLQYRITGVLAAVALIAVAYRILRRVGVERPIALAACALMALDPILLEFLRLGRMDLLAILFFLLGFLLLLDSGRTAGRRGLLYSGASGAFAALGVLTTPRPGYLLIPLGLILAHRCLAGPTAYRVAQLAAWIAGFAPCCIAWIAFAFGGMGPLVAYFSEFAGTFAGGTFGTVSIQKPILASLLFFALLKGIKEPRLLLNEFTIFVGLAIVLFFLTVKNLGTFGGGYQILAVPFEYMALAWLISNCPRVAAPLPTVILQRAALVSLFLLNGAAFAAVVGSDALLWSAFDPSEAKQLITSRIPPGSKVVGDDKFYFLVREAGSDFQYLERGGTLAERARYHADDYGFDYLITSADENSEILSAYRNRADLVRAGEIDAPIVSRLTRYLLRIRGTFMLWVFTMNYRGTIYERVR